MASTNYIDNVTVIYASWLNDVNVATYTTLPALQANLASNYAPLVSPAFVTPSLGVATATTINGVTINTGVLSGTNTGDQQLFRTISVSGQSDVVADNTADTLTLVAGTGITITTNAATDTITFTGTTTPALTLVATIVPTAGSTAVSMLNVFTSTYNNYLIKIEGIQNSGSTANLDFRFANAGVVDATAVYYTGTGIALPVVTLTPTSNMSITSPLGVSGTIVVTNVNSASTVKSIQSSVSYKAATNYGNDSVVASYTRALTASGFHLALASGTWLAQGVVRVYGYSN